MQGPPGSGKTWNGARMAIALMQAGQRVGITALSHKAIHKFLEDVEEARRRGRLHVPRHEEGRAARTAYEGTLRRATRARTTAMLDPELQLLAGTSWLFAREDMDQHVDTLFIDEGGQFALADALAVGDGGAKPRPPRRPEPAAAGLAGLAPAGGGGVGARPPARRRRDRAAGDAGSSSSGPGGCGRR